MQSLDIVVTTTASNEIPILTCLAIATPRDRVYCLGKIEASEVAKKCGIENHILESIEVRSRKNLIGKIAPQAQINIANPTRFFAMMPAIFEIIAEKCKSVERHDATIKTPLGAMTHDHILYTTITAAKFSDLAFGPFTIRFHVDSDLARFGFSQEKFWMDTSYRFIGAESLATFMKDENFANLNMQTGALKKYLMTTKGASSSASTVFSSVSTEKVNSWGDAPDLSGKATNLSAWSAEIPDRLERTKSKSNANEGAKVGQSKIENKNDSSKNKVDGKTISASIRLSTQEMHEKVGQLWNRGSITKAEALEEEIKKKTKTDEVLDSLESELAEALREKDGNKARIIKKKIQEAQLGADSVKLTAKTLEEELAEAIREKNGEKARMIKQKIKDSQLQDDLYDHYSEPDLMSLGEEEVALGVTPGSSTPKNISANTTSIKEYALKLDHILKSLGEEKVASGVTPGAGNSKKISANTTSKTAQEAGSSKSMGTKSRAVKPSVDEKTSVKKNNVKKGAAAAKTNRTKKL